MDILTNTTYNGEVKQYDGGVNSDYLKYSIIDTGNRKHLFAEFVLPNSEFQAHDRFAIGAIAKKQGHEIQAADSYMIAMDASRTGTPDGQDISLWRQMGNRFYNENGTVIG